MPVVAVPGCVGGPRQRLGGQPVHVAAHGLFHDLLRGAPPPPGNHPVNEAPTLLVQVAQGDGQGLPVGRTVSLPERED
jgi:hypothetical protein